MTMKGIILAGGKGSRLYPLTLVTSKQLLPIYDKPMIYYPLSILMLAGIRDILIISTPQDIDRFKALLGTGDSMGITLQYQVQNSPDGLAQALIIGETFLGSDPCALILGDNIFYGNGLVAQLNDAVHKTTIQREAVVFGYYVNNPKRYGIVEFDKNYKVISVVEKPQHPKSNYALTGLYFYPAGVSNMAKKVQPSARGELEITSLNEMYLKQNKLSLQILGRGYSWFDTGTIDSLVEASSFVCSLDKNQSIKTAVPEEIAHRYGWITDEQLTKTIEKLGNGPYSRYLKDYIEKKFM